MGKRYVMESKINISELKIPGCYLIQSFCTEDSRGRFVKFYHDEIFSSRGITLNFKELFYTVSCKKTLRGIHFQEPRHQGKLIHCVKGQILDLLVDLRNYSPAFGQWQFITLDAERPSSVFLPEGIGHAYLALEDSVVCYCCNELFYAEDDTGIIWNDEELNIQWPLDMIGGEKQLILSDKDRTLQTFCQWKKKNNIL